MKTILMFPGVALAATLGFAQPTLAASSQQSDENIGHQAQSDTNGPAEKMEDSDQIRQQNWDRDGREQGATGSRAGWMGHHNRRFGARDEGGAHFRFIRGNARIDIKCPANEDVEHCVKAAGDLVEKVMSMKEHAGTELNLISPPSRKSIGLSVCSAARPFGQSIKMPACMFRRDRCEAVFLFVLKHQDAKFLLTVTTSRLLPRRNISRRGRRLDWWRMNFEAHIR